MKNKIPEYGYLLSTISFILLTYNVFVDSNTNIAIFWATMSIIFLLLKMSCDIKNK